MLAVVVVTDRLVVVFCSVVVGAIDDEVVESWVVMVVVDSPIVVVVCGTVIGVVVVLSKIVVLLGMLVLVEGSDVLVVVSVKLHFRTVSHELRPDGGGILMLDPLV